MATDFIDINTGNFFNGDEPDKLGTVPVTGRIIRLFLIPQPNILYGGNVSPSIIQFYFRSSLRIGHRRHPVSRRIMDMETLYPTRYPVIKKGRIFDTLSSAAWPF